MKKVMLCGHTGCNNRGCEAIIRSTVDILLKNNIGSQMGSFAKKQDEKVGLDKVIEISEYRGYKNKYSPFRIYNGLCRKIFKDYMPTERYIQRDIFKKLKKIDCALIVGGDTYCYSRPENAYGVNKYANAINKKTVFWSCSVERTSIDDEMVRDLKRYAAIFPREIETYNNLIDAGIEKERLFQMSDSAFVLPCEEIELPEGFENVLAYNPSYTISVRGNRVFENRENLIENILNNTDLKIAFVPHVYDKDFGDAVVCQEMYAKYKDTGRVFLFDGIYNCMQLKYIISKCRFLVAERTHASIAGYSTCVPTFVLGYSVKSQGIAKDIFGQAENYVYPADKLEGDNDYFERIQFMLENEENIRQRLTEFMPEYINRAWEAGKRLSEILEKE